LRGSSTEEALETRAKKTTSSLRRLRGAVDENPCREIREERSNPRRRYVNEAEYATAYKAMPAGAVRHGTCRPDGPAARATSCPWHVHPTDDGIEIQTSQTGSVC